MREKKNAQYFVDLPKKSYACKRKNFFFCFLQFNLLSYLRIWYFVLYILFMRTFIENKLKMMRAHLETSSRRIDACVCSKDVINCKRKHQNGKRCLKKNWKGCVPICWSLRIPAKDLHFNIFFYLSIYVCLPLLLLLCIA